MNRLIIRILAGCLLLFVTTVSSPAQSKGAAEANAAAYEIYSSGDYANAAAAYEKVLRDYPTDAIAPTAQIQLAFTYYFLARFDEAVAILAKATSGPPLPGELKQVTDALLPQILSSKAAAMPEGDAKRKTTFDDAIAKFSDYITKYPQATDLESMIFGRAISEYQIKKFDEAVKDLELNLQKFPQSGTIATSKNLLAITLATQGSEELSKGDSADKAKAFALYKKATDFLREIINKKEDVALINEANFQLGEILMNQAASSPEVDRPPLYKEALAAFRAIAPKEDIIKLQESKLREFPLKKREALQRQDTVLIKKLNADNERELKKLAELQGKPDQTATALLKMAEIYFQEGDYNAARVVLKHVSSFLSADDEKKRELYFTTMSYALQNAVDRAPTGYNQFQAKYKSDPLADNLPFAMGSMYLNLKNPTEAIRYFDESLSLYPQGRFTAFSVVSKAQAEAGLGKYEDAMKTFKTFLDKNPPPEIGVIAQSGLAGIYRDTQKWDDAIAAYKTTIEKYPKTPQAIDAEYWIGFSTQQKGDHAAAIPLLETFVKAQPKSPLAPIALYLKGGAQIALGQKAEAAVTLAAVANEYPDSQPAPFTYFTRAQLAGSEGKPDEVVTLMKQFIEKYPKDDKVFFAYEMWAQTLLGAGKTEEGLNAYREFVQKYPESPQAGDALLKVAELQRAKAEGLGRYGALNEAERAQWKPLLDSSIAASEEMIKKYPDSPALAVGLQTLLKSQRMMLSAELKKADEVQQYFQALADAAPPNAKSKILFTLANYVSEQDKAKALAIMTSAYNPDIVYSPQDLDFYGLALLGEKKYDEAAAVFDKLATKDYPIPAGIPPEQITPIIQEAQAIALFGKGRVAQAKGETAQAGTYFEQLKVRYPWSPKVLEANFGIAESLKQQNKLDEALQLLGAIIRERNASGELRANSMLLYGDILVEQMKTAPDEKTKDELLKAAIDNYIKIAQYYEGVNAAAARGLWLGGQLLEQQANTSTDPKFKEQQLNRAKGAYQQLQKAYPNSEFAPKAQERLKALGGQ